MREDKKTIVMLLALLLKATRAGSGIADLILNDRQDEVTILFKAGGTRKVNISADSGISIIRDVIQKI